jgi:hypothetical protein
VGKDGKPLTDKPKETPKDEQEKGKEKDTFDYSKLDSTKPVKCCLCPKTEDHEKAAWQHGWEFTKGGRSGDIYWKCPTCKASTAKSATTVYGSYYGYRGDYSSLAVCDTCGDTANRMSAREQGWDGNWDSDQHEYIWNCKKCLEAKAEEKAKQVAMAQHWLKRENFKCILCDAVAKNCDEAFAKEWAFVGTGEGYWRCKKCTDELKKNSLKHDTKHSNKVVNCAFCNDWVMDDDSAKRVGWERRRDLEKQLDYWVCKLCKDQPTCAVCRDYENDTNSASKSGWRFVQDQNGSRWLCDKCKHVYDNGRETHQCQFCSAVIEGGYATAAGWEYRSNAEPQPYWVCSHCKSSSYPKNHHYGSGKVNAGEVIKCKECKSEILSDYAAVNKWTMVAGAKGAYWICRKCYDQKWGASSGLGEAAARGRVESSSTPSMQVKEVVYLSARSIYSDANWKEVVAERDKEEHEAYLAALQREWEEEEAEEEEKGEVIELPKDDDDRVVQDSDMDFGSCID